VTAAESALREGVLRMRMGATLRCFPGLNHLFMPVPGTSAGAVYIQPGQHVAAKLVLGHTEWGAPTRPAGVFGKSEQRRRLLQKT
jgi:hypothetical protein